MVNQDRGFKEGGVVDNSDLNALLKEAINASEPDDDTSGKSRIIVNARMGRQRSLRRLVVTGIMVVTVSIALKFLG